ncbi:hypothetical protein, partial [Amycolatopsis lurida]|uniref:hypothetical protein n=1 Tax=Amycolatopsis lurida TaxID=31959 RepID=UPI00365AFCAD
KPEDLAWMTSVFLGMTHLTPTDPNTQLMHTTLRELLERDAFGGRSIGGELNRVSGKVPSDPAHHVFAEMVRPAMQGNQELVDEAWYVLQHNRVAMTAFPDGPWVAE